jgi:hypothetical protein
MNIHKHPQAIYMHESHRFVKGHSSPIFSIFGPKAEDVTKSGGSALVGAAEIYMGCGDSKLVGRDP